MTASSVTTAVRSRRFPPDRGDKIATYNQVRHLSRAHEVHVFCTADSTADMENVVGAEKFAASVTAVPVHGWRGRPVC